MNEEELSEFTEIMKCLSKHLNDLLNPDGIDSLCFFCFVYPVGQEGEVKNAGCVSNVSFDSFSPIIQRYFEYMKEKEELH